MTYSCRTFSSAGSAFVHAIGMEEEGGRGVEEGGWSKMDRLDIGLISIIYTKTPHRDMTQMNRNVITIFLNENCVWIITQ